MTHSDFESTIDRLLAEGEHLAADDRKRLLEIAQSTRERHEKLKQTINSLQETLDFLRLSVKYLVFDIEATKRENAYLRKMLEESNGAD